MVITSYDRLRGLKRTEVGYYGYYGQKSVGLNVWSLQVGGIRVFVGESVPAFSSVW